MKYKCFRVDFQEAEGCYWEDGKETDWDGSMFIWDSFNIGRNPWHLWQSNFTNLKSNSLSLDSDVYILSFSAPFLA